MAQVVLVVEDNSDLREEVALVLADKGYTVHTAPDGRRALELLNDAPWRPDLIVSDVLMPRMDGYQFVRAVRAIPDLNDVPFIFLTAYGTRQDMRIGRELGSDDYLIKPFDPEEFLNAVQIRLQRVAQMRIAASERLNGDRRAIVQILSHELRTPLTYISGGLSLLTEELSNNLSADATTSLELIHNGTSRLTRLVEQAVLYAELASGHVKLQLHTAGMPLSISALARQAVDLHQLDAAERYIPLELKLPSEPLSVFGIGNLLVQAFSELLRNAIRYSAEDKEVCLQVVDEPGFAVIQVIDHGRGIPPEDIEQVWNVLAQAERQKYEQQGAGLGLPIARLAIEAHGGQISLTSVLGQGTTVTARLPLC
ncbi:MAG: hybrid sensor histidine kinase/response regulator [Aggregatilineales bacterium]